MSGAMQVRIGQGYDIHRLVPGRPLLLAGVPIDSPLGSLGHSDGDVVLHALMDALLGALALGDIGEHFPPNDQRYKDADSAVLLQQVMGLVFKAGYQVGNVDMTVFLEAPKLKAYKVQIQQQVAALLKVNSEQVSVKAKTAEGLGDIGASNALAACVTVLLLPK